MEKLYNFLYRNILNRVSFMRRKIYRIFRT